MPEQLEMWKEKHDKPIKAPFTNANLAAWRDDPKAVESADFDPEVLSFGRSKNR